MLLTQCSLTTPCTDTSSARHVKCVSSFVVSHRLHLGAAIPPHAAPSPRNLGGTHRASARCALAGAQAHVNLVPVTRALESLYVYFYVYFFIPLLAKSKTKHFKQLNESSSPNNLVTV